MADRDLTLRELGLLIGRSEGTVRAILGGAAAPAPIARRLARCLRRPVDDLFVDTGASDEQADSQRRAVAS